MAEREFDVVVFGATGLSGRLVAGYLAERCDGTGMRWAPAARDAARLERALSEVGVWPEETIAADIEDPDSLTAMAARTSVVLNLVGPYTLHGRPVIEACVAAGTHHLDLSGEIPYVRRVIDAFDARAAESGVKLVQVCGVEALPPDLLVALADATARERHGEGLAEADVELRGTPPFAVPRPSDIVSGGTLQSLAIAAADESAALVTDPAALVTDPVAAAEIRRHSPIAIAPRRGSKGAVIAPMAPAAYINPAVIHRTSALLAGERGASLEALRYREGLALDGGAASLPARYALAGMLAGTQMAMGAVVRAGPSVRRRISRGLRRVLPSSGFGPAPDRLSGWRWRLSVEGRTRGGGAVHTEVEADGHPGYLATARMLGEAGLMIAEPGVVPDRAGCLTPATAFGTDSLERFEHARARFRVRA